MHWRHIEDICANKSSATEWLDQLSKQKWVQCFNEGKGWGHMTTNLSESVNSMLKNTRHLSVSSLVEETYFKTAQLFANRGQQTQAMINFGSQYSEVVLLRWTKRKMNEQVEKKCELCRQHGHSRNNCPNISPS